MLRGISKRKRRSADEIRRHFACTVPNCSKSYGSESALKMHQKIKHDIHDDDVVVSNPKLMKFKHLLVTAQKDLGPSANATGNTPSNTSQKKKQKTNTVGETTTKVKQSRPNPVVVVTPPPVTATESPPPASIKNSPPTSPFSSPPKAAANTLPINPALELALNIPLVKLQMDLWERSSLYFGDLIARVSLTERKFSWESVNLEGLVRITLPFDDVERLVLENNTLKLVGSVSPSCAVKTIQLGTPVWTPLPETSLLGKNRTHLLHIHKVTNLLTLCQFLMADQHLRSVSILAQEF